MKETTFDIAVLVIFNAVQKFLSNNRSGILCTAGVAVPVIHTISAMQTIWIDFDPLVDSQAAFDF